MCKNIASDILTSTLLDVINDPQILYTYNNREEEKTPVYLYNNLLYRQFTQENITPRPKTAAEQSIY